MASQNDIESMAVFCDFENLALGVRDVRMARFDIQKILERLLLKGSIVVKKAYCDWDRYKEFKGAMHEASFELIEIPHVRISGKNSADIRLVVDALDLCYTKSHVDTFVILSGDSDFSPLVSKLRENNKIVIGVGVKQSSSDLLVNNCDEFIFYDDLVRAEKTRRTRGRRRPSERGADAGAVTVATNESPGEATELQEGGAPIVAASVSLVTPATPAAPPPAEVEVDRRQKAIALVIETLEALSADRGSGERIWGSMVKQTLKRRQPSFNEAYYGYRSFSKLLEDAKAQGLIELELDEKSGGYILRPMTPEENQNNWESTPAEPPAAEAEAAAPVDSAASAAMEPEAAETSEPESEGGASTKTSAAKRRRPPRSRSRRATTTDAGAEPASAATPRSVEDSAVDIAQPEALAAPLLAEGVATDPEVASPEPNDDDVTPESPKPQPRRRRAPRRKTT